MATEAIGAPAHAGALVPHTSLQVRAAIKEARPARIMLDGPSGSGRTWTGLALAAGLAGDGGRIGVIDTNGGASLRYADQFAFTVAELEEFSPEHLLKALYEVGAAGCDIVLVDDYSKFWSGPGGLLELVDAATREANQEAAKARQPAPSGAGWTAVRPRERAALEALAAFPGHVIVTVTALPETVLEDVGDGLTGPRRHGLRLDQRQGVDGPYDFALSLLPGGEHRAVVSKSHMPELTGRLLDLRADSARQLGARIDAWAREGADRWPMADFYARAYDLNTTIEDLELLLGQLTDTRSLRVAAFNAWPRRAEGKDRRLDEQYGAPIALGVLVRRRLESMRAEAARARRFAPPAPAAPQPPAPARPAPAAPQPPADRPAPAPAAPPPPAALKADRPASRPLEIPLVGETNPINLATAGVVALIRAPGAWDDTIKLAKAFAEASTKRVVDEPVRCEDGSGALLRTVLTARQDELKGRALIDTI
ncbi:AAA family ATPase [Kitasatospora sp. NPDC097605]|uniref:AAA family ATPase n=1 Tax=Kitasatospora sp. NPDC097605 TaxID=3157226 RepID=UPI003326E20A